MIQAIGVMIAFYIFARLSEIIDKKESRRGTKILSYISGIVTILCLLAVLGGSDY